MHTAAEATSKHHSSGENRNVAIPLWRDGLGIISQQLQPWQGLAKSRLLPSFGIQLAPAIFTSYMLS